MEKGFMFLANGIKYEGEYKNNKKDGNGILYDRSGKIIFSGLWVNGEPSR
jgi:antitoxin component YwqK of YwqJK toxin-antitoxin module